MLIKKANDFQIVLQPYHDNNYSKISQLTYLQYCDIFQKLYECNLKKTCKQGFHHPTYTSSPWKQNFIFLFKFRRLVIWCPTRVRTSVWGEKNANLLSMSKDKTCPISLPNERISVRQKRNSIYSQTQSSARSIFCLFLQFSWNL